MLAGLLVSPTIPAYSCSTALHHPLPLPLCTHLPRIYLIAPIMRLMLMPLSSLHHLRIIDQPEHRPAISSTLVALSRATSTPYVPPRFPTVPTGHFMYLALPSLQTSLPPFRSLPFSDGTTAVRLAKCLMLGLTSPSVTPTYSTSCIVLASLNTTHASRFLSTSDIGSRISS